MDFFQSLKEFIVVFFNHLHTVVYCGAFAVCCCFMCTHFFLVKSEEFILDEDA